MDEVGYLRELLQQALPYVEAWTDTSVHKSGVPKVLGSREVHGRLVKQMRDEAVRTK